MGIIIVILAFAGLFVIGLLIGRSAVNAARRERERKSNAKRGVKLKRAGEDPALKE